MARILPNPEPFQNYKVYGPYLGTKEQRRIVVLVNLRGKTRTTISYARYLLSINNGRELISGEEADHIDNNRLNDSIDNLQILSKLNNILKSSKGKTLVILICPMCKNKFTRERRQTHIIKGGRNTCCSRSCAGKYQFIL